VVGFFACSRIVGVFMSGLVGVLKKVLCLLEGSVHRSLVVECGTADSRL
jgi:hypothetical protein